MSEDPRRNLREAYDRRVDDRDARPAPAWESAERDGFLLLLLQEKKRTLLELGASTGADALVFKASGLDVVCIDLSPGMVTRCQAKGLVAHVMDVEDLQFPSDSFDGVYAMNCLVHVPKAELPEALDGIRRVLKPEGLFYLGVYGGRDFEGIREDDPYDPKRFFSHYPDADLTEIVSRFFDVLSFRRIPHGWSGLHFQSVVLRKP